MKYLPLVIALVCLCVVAHGQAKKPAAKPAAETSEALLARMQKKLAAVKTAKGVLEGKGADGAATKITFAMMRPNFFSIVGGDYELHGTGSKYYYYSKKENVYIASQPTREAPTFLSSILLGLEAVTGQETVWPPSGDSKSTTFQSKKALMLELEGVETKVDLYLDPVSLHPLGFKQLSSGVVSVYKDLMLDKPMKPADFAWSPPKGAVEKKA